MDLLLKSSFVNEIPQQALKSEKTHSDSPRTSQPGMTAPIFEKNRQIVKSLPNAEQDDNLTIRFSPNAHFEQGTNYCYPVVKMPKAKASLKLPRLGRTNQRGYKEKAFTDYLRFQITGLEVADNERKSY